MSKSPQSPNSSKPNPEENRKAGLAYAAGLTVFASVAAGAGFGYLLDRWLETQPWCLVGGLVVGSAAGLIEFVRLSSKTY